MSPSMILKQFFQRHHSWTHFFPVQNNRGLSSLFSLDDIPSQQNQGTTQLFSCKSLFLIEYFSPMSSIKYPNALILSLKSSAFPKSFSLLAFCLSSARVFMFGGIENFSFFSRFKPKTSSIFFIV